MPDEPSQSRRGILHWRLHALTLREWWRSWRELSEAGFTREIGFWWRPLWMVLAMLSVLLAAALSTDVSREAYVSAAVGTALLVGGYFEWKSARHESSLDKFYERLCIANESNEKLGDGGDTGAFGNVKYGELALYVYRELDNFEYVLERYRRGYIDVALAVRGLRTFQSRIAKPIFRAELERLGNLVDNAGYCRHTNRVVERLLATTPLVGGSTPAGVAEPVPGSAALTIEVKA